VAKGLKLSSKILSPESAKLTWCATLNHDNDATLLLLLALYRLEIYCRQFAARRVLLSFRWCVACVPFLRGLGVV
jgi:hypothetical protein